MTKTFKRNPEMPRAKFVSIESAARHAQMAELFGLPTVTTKNSDELFGPYSVDGEQCFWRYSSATDAWTVLTCPERARCLFLPATGESFDGFLDAFDVLRACPPEEFPLSVSTREVREPFVFEGWRFFWVFEPILARWELAFDGRA